jgi:Holliday junction resolvase RusA-like endonuclease
MSRHGILWREPVARFTCPIAPSLNNLFVSRRDGKGRAAISAYKTWQKFAGMMVNLQHPEPVKGRARVLVEGPFAKNSDIDNRLKGTLDLLVSLGLIEADRLVDDLRIVRCGPASNRMTISIWKI